MNPTTGREEIGSAKNAGVLVPVTPDPVRHPSARAIAKPSIEPFVSTSTYVRELDGVRAIAVLLVLVHHLQFKSVFGLGWFAQVGWAGVDIFFVLSGFLITNLLVAEFRKDNDVNLRKFWIRRAIRIWPSFFFTLLICSVLTWGISRNNPEVWSHWKSQILAYVFFSANYSKIFSGDLSFPFGHLWSLAVEEHFYIFWPILFLLSGKKRKTLIATCIGLCVLSLIIRFVYFRNVAAGSPFEFRMAFSTETRADSILWGCLLSLIANEFHFKESRKWILFLPLILLISQPGRISPFTYSWIAVGSASLLMVAAFSSKSGAARWFLRSSVMTLIGRTSYNIYLVHLPVYLVFFSFIDKYHLGDTNKFLLASIAVSLSIIAGATQYWIIDRPLVAYRKAFR